jgi:hypothetical protein
MAYCIPTSSKDLAHNECEEPGHPLPLIFSTEYADDRAHLWLLWFEKDRRVP